MLNMWLTEAEIISLTRRRRHSLQVEALRAMGVEHKIRDDGSAAVLRSHVEKLFGGTSSGNVITEVPFGRIKRAN